MTCINIYLAMCNIYNLDFTIEKKHIEPVTMRKLGNLWLEFQKCQEQFYLKHFIINSTARSTIPKVLLLTGLLYPNKGIRGQEPKNLDTALLRGQGPAETDGMLGSSKPYSKAPFTLQS